MGEHPSLKLLSMVLKDSQRWGILGGAFDPPHLGHLSLAESICEAAGLDGVLFLPTPTPPHKDKPMTSFADRHAMLKLAIAENKHFVVSRYEEELPAPHYTVNTLQGLTQTFPNVTFNLIVGADNLRILAKWYQVREVLKLAPALVGSRPGQPNKIELEPELSDSVTFYEIPLLDVSSTELRSRIAQGKSIRYLVPDSVIAYIQSHELYTHNHNK